MDSFWTQHGWAIPLWLLGLVGLFAVLIRARRSPDARFSQMVFWLFPPLDPDRRLKPTRVAWGWRLIVIVAILILVLE